jgi:anti-sigma regulatory factor (Ser/Thr protein kinase)
MIGLGCEGAYINETVLAVQEAMANVVRHAYRGNETGEIIIAIRQCGDDLVIRLTDFAPEIDQRQFSRRDPRDVHPGGLGVYIIDRIMDRVEFMRPGPGEGNILEMSRRLDGS